MNKLLITFLCLIVSDLTFAAEQNTKDEQFREFLVIMDIEEGTKPETEARRLAQEERRRQFRLWICGQEMESTVYDEKVDNCNDERCKEIGPALAELLEMVRNNTLTTSEEN